MRKVFEGIVFGMRFNLAVKGFKLHATCIKSVGMTKVIILIIISLLDRGWGVIFCLYVRICQQSGFSICLIFQIACFEGFV